MIIDIKLVFGFILKIKLNRNVLQNTYIPHPGLFSSISLPVLMLNLDLRQHTRAEQKKKKNLLIGIKTMFILIRVTSFNIDLSSFSSALVFLISQESVMVGLQ